VVATLYTFGGYPLKAGQFPSFKDLAQRCVFVAETEAKRRCGIKPFQKDPETTA
jgi:hypothetical protein